MDARIEVLCRSCGRVELTPTAIDLVVDAAADATYGFTCPGCERRVRRPANDTVVRMLELGGVRAHAPVRYPEHLAPEAADLPAFTHDDLLAFHELLESPAWHLALVS